MTENDVLHVAIGEIGVKENPKGSNKVKYNTWYYGREVSGSAYPWCMTFVQWVFNEAGMPLPLKTASCSALMNYYKERGKFYTKDFRPGDIALFNFKGGPSVSEHVGIIESVLKDSVVTIEGNTSLTSDDNGGNVMQRIRNNGLVIGVIRPDYEGGEEVTQAEFDRMMDNWLERQKKEDLPAWAREELQEAVEMGITDGERPMQFIPRYQAAIMAMRAAKK